MKAAVSVANNSTNSSQSPHLVSKIRKGRWTAWNSKIRAKKTGAELFRELSRLNLGSPSNDDDRKSTYAVMIGEIPKEKEEEDDLDSLLEQCIDFGEAASKNGAVSVPVPAPTVSIPSPPAPAPVSESVDHKITASVGDSGVPSSMEMDMELGMTLDDILDAILFL